MKKITVNPEKLIEYILDQPWHKKCDIIPDYMPPYPGKDTKPSVQIKYNGYGDEHPPFLRYGSGPIQVYFWDIYGSDFQSVELAIIALSKAPAPIDVSPIKFTLSLNNKEGENNG